MGFKKNKDVRKMLNLGNLLEHPVIEELKHFMEWNARGPVPTMANQINAFLNEHPKVEQCQVTIVSDKEIEVIFRPEKSDKFIQTIMTVTKNEINEEDDTDKDI